MHDARARCGHIALNKVCHNLRAIGVFTGGEQDVTEQAYWSSSDSAIASVNNADGERGLVTARAEGTVTVQASLDGIAGEAEVTVEPAP